MHKVILHTYWVMYGKETGDRSKIIDKAWLTATLPPFYKGVGISIRLPFRRSIRLGICHPRMPVTVDEYAYVDDFDANLDALAGYEIEPEEVTEWVSSADPRTT